MISILLESISGDHSLVKFFMTNYPATKELKNKEGLTPLQIAQKRKFTRIAKLIETGEDIPETTEDEKPQIKHDPETLKEAARNGRAQIIQEFIDQRYESREEKRKLCFELLQIAKKAQQLQILDILQPYYNSKLKNELPSDIEAGSAVRLSEHYKKILLASLNGLSTVIANSPHALDPADPQTYIDFYSCLMTRTEKRSEQLEKVTNEQELKKFIEQDQNIIMEELAKLKEEIENVTQNKNDVQARIHDIDTRLFEQQNMTASEQKRYKKDKELFKQQLASHESTILLVRRQEEATLLRQATFNFIKGNSNLMMFYQTIENHLQALFHSVLAAQGGYLQTQPHQTITFLNQIPLSNCVDILFTIFIDVKCGCFSF